MCKNQYHVTQQKEDIVKTQERQREWGEAEGVFPEGLQRLSNVQDDEMSPKYYKGSDAMQDKAPGTIPKIGNQGCDNNTM